MLSIEHGACVIASPQLQNYMLMFLLLCLLFCITEGPFASMWSMWQQLSAGRDDFHWGLNFRAHLHTATHPHPHRICCPNPIRTLQHQNVMF